MLYAYLTGKESQDTIVRGFAKGAGAQILPIQHYLKGGIPPKASGVIFAGMLRGNMLLYNDVMAKGVDYYYIDHAYFKSGYDHPAWMRVTRNGFAQNNIITNDQTRWNTYFQKPMMPYNFEDKSKILVLPPSPAVKRTFGVDNWLDKVIRTLTRHTNRQIVVREKGGPVLDSTGTKTIEWQKFHHPQTIDEMWNDLYCVVTFNSAVGIQALQKGIPTICTKFCPAWPLSNKLENIENLLKFNRTPLFASLSWGQYTLDEMESGEAIRYVNKFNQIVKT